MVIVQFQRYDASVFVQIIISPASTWLVYNFLQPIASSREKCKTGIILVFSSSSHLSCWWTWIFRNFAKLCPFFCAKPNQAKPSQSEPSWSKPSQSEPSWSKPSQADPMQASNGTNWICYEFTIDLQCVSHEFTPDLQWIYKHMPKAQCIYTGFTSSSNY